VEKERIMVAQGVLTVGKEKKEVPARDDVAVKIARPIWRRAGAVAAFRGISLAEYLSSALAPIVSKDFDSLSREGKVDANRRE
jgi:hypothetical protein